jgi:hypothetical protein
MTAPGWLYISDDGIEWSADHPVRSGLVPDARLIRRATNTELLGALKDAWEAHNEAVQSEARLRSRAQAAEAERDRLREALEAIRARVRVLTGPGYGTHPLVVSTARQFDDFALAALTPKAEEPAS